jgi:hypothetical protein
MTRGASVTALALIVVFLAALAAEPASGDTLCVTPRHCAQPFDGLRAALDEAAARQGEDTIELGERQYSDGPFCYTATDPLHIVGEGASKTVLTMATPAAPCALPPDLDPISQAAVITLTNEGLPPDAPEARITISDVGVDIPASDGVTGMLLEAVAAHRVEITAGSNATQSTGAVMVWDSNFVDGTVELPTSSLSNGFVTYGPSFIQARSIKAAIGVDAGGFPTNVARSRITAITGVWSRGLTGVDSTLVTIADDQPGVQTPAIGLIQLGGTGEPFPNFLLARNVTIYGRGGTTVGAGAFAEMGTSALVNVFDSILANVGHSVRRIAEDGAVANVNTSFSNYSPAPTPGGGGIGGISEFNFQPGEPKFLDPDAGKFQLDSDSPLIDVGSPGPVFTDQSPLDLERNPRVLDGRMAPGEEPCAARRDLGAFEYVPKEVLVRATVVSDAVAGRPVEFDASASCDPDPGASLAYRWSFDDGGSAGGARVLHTFTTPGQHEVRVDVTSSAGRPGSAMVNVLVGPAQTAGLGGPDTGAKPQGVLNKRPRARRLDIRPFSFLAAGAGASIARSTGASVRYQLSEPAKVRFTVQRLVRRRNGRTRFVKVRGSFTHQGRKDSNKFRFTGRLAGRKLRPGRYRLVGVPTDATGNRGKPARAGFRIATR